MKRFTLTIALAAALAAPAAASATDTTMKTQMMAQMHAGVAFVQCQGQHACAVRAITLMHVTTRLINHATAGLYANTPNPTCLAASRRFAAADRRLLGALSVWSQSGFDSLMKPDADTAEVAFAKTMQPVLDAC